MMTKHTRRESIKWMGAGALAFSFLRLGAASEGMEASPQEFGKWLASLNKNSAQLAESQVSPLQWQEQMDKIYSQVPMVALKDKLDFKSLSKAIVDKMPAERGEYFQRIEISEKTGTLPSGNEKPRRLITKVAHIRKGASIPPHGHSNMASAFLCLSGEFKVKQYDRLAIRENELVVRESKHVDSAGPGTWSSISDYRDNVHWLTAKSDDCFLFTCKMIGVEPNVPLKGRINIDLQRARQLGSSTYAAPKISSSEAHALYN